MMKNDRQKLLMFIHEVGFALGDVILYLDTHPTDKQALEYYENYQKLYKQAHSEYASLYGPLSAGDVTSSTEWTWVRDPWPWEPMGRSVCN